MPQPWEQLPNEPDEWYSKFIIYKNLPQRTLAKAVESWAEKKKKKVASSGGKLANGTWAKYSKDFNWVERADAWDKHFALRISEKTADLRQTILTNSEQIVIKVQELIKEILEIQTQEQWNKSIAKISALGKMSEKWGSMLMGFNAHFFGENIHISTSNGQNTTINSNRIPSDFREVIARAGMKQIMNGSVKVQDILPQGEVIDVVATNGNNVPLSNGHATVEPNT